MVDTGVLATWLGSLLMLAGLAGAAVNLWRSRETEPERFVLGSVWGPLVPVVLGTAALLFSVGRWVVGRWP